MKKIALISFYNISSSKGIEKFLMTLYSGLKQDFSIDVFSMTHDYRGERGMHEYYIPYFGGLGYFLYVILVGLRLCLIRRSYDIVVGNNINTFIVCLCKRYGLWNKKIPIITICHNVKKSYYDALVPGRYSIAQKILLYVDGICYRYSDIVIATSNGIQQQLINEYSISSEKISLIINSLPSQEEKRISLKQKKRRLVFVSGDHQRKGVEIVHQLGAILHNKNSDIVISIVGPIVDDIDGENIISEGYIDNSRLLDYVAESLVFMLPSKNEGLPLSLLEAISVGTPFIASKESNVEMLHDIAGKVITSRNPEEYYQALLDILEKYEHFQNDGFDYLKKNSVEGMIQKYGQIFSNS